MKKTYEKTFFGTPEAVEAGIRKFDQCLRRMYNVYGGKRVYSAMHEWGEYEVSMRYTADWGMAQFLPEFSIYAINTRFWKEMNRTQYADYLSCDIVKEVPENETGDNF